MVIKSERGVYGYFVILLLNCFLGFPVSFHMGASFLFSVLYQIPLMILSCISFRLDEHYILTKKDAPFSFCGIKKQYHGIV